LKFVIDNGYAYVDSFDPAAMERQLFKKRITQAQAVQRRGRVGRTEPGTCICLYTEQEFNEMPKYPISAILRSDLTDDVLRFIAMPAVQSVQNLYTMMNQMIEPPPKSHILAGLVELWFTGALEGEHPWENGTLTSLGKRMAQCRLLSPSQCIFLLSAYETYCFKDALKIVAMLIVIDGQMSNILDDRAARDAKKNGRPIPYGKFLSKTSDIWTLHTIANAYEETKGKMEGNRSQQNGGFTGQPIREWARQYGLNYSSLEKYSKHIRMILQDIQRLSRNPSPTEIALGEVMDREEDMKVESEKKLNQQMGGMHLPPLTSLLPNHWKDLVLSKDGDIKDRVMQCYVLSRASHFARKGKNKHMWTPSVALKPEQYGFTRESSVSHDSTTSAIIFEEAANIFDQRKMNILTKIQAKQWKHLPACMMGFLEEKEKKQEPHYGYGERLRKEVKVLIPMPQAQVQNKNKKNHPKKFDHHGHTHKHKKHSFKFHKKKYVGKH
jgi:HrpA-like RNA helicase